MSCQILENFVSHPQNTALVEIHEHSRASCMLYAVQYRVRLCYVVVLCCRAMTACRVTRSNMHGVLCNVIHVTDFLCSRMQRQVVTRCCVILYSAKL